MSDSAPSVDLHYTPAGAQVALPALEPIDRRIGDNADEHGMLQDAEAELAVLGVLGGWCWAPHATEQAAALVFEIVTENEFSYEATRTLFRACRSVYEETGTLDPVMVQSSIRADSGIARWLDGSTVIQVLRDTGDHFGTHRVRQYCERLRACSARSKALTALDTARRDLLTPGDAADVDAVLNTAQAKLGMIGPQATRPIQKAGVHIVTELVPAVMNGDLTEVVCGTGWAAFDDEFLNGGFRRGRLSVVMAKRKTGKSTLLASVARESAKTNRRTGILSLEMNESEVSTRIVCAEAGIDTRAVERGKLPNEDRGVFRSAALAMSELPLYIKDTRGLSVHQALSWARSLKAQGGLDLLCIDYLQLFSDHLHRESRERNLSDATRRILVAAQELDCHIILLSQLNQEGQAKWSGQTNDDAHFNWRVVRVDQKASPDEEGDYWRFTVEQRFGRSGTVDRLYKPDLATGRITETNRGVRPAQERGGRDADY